VGRRGLRKSGRFCIRGLTTSHLFKPIYKSKNAKKIKENNQMK